jgi:hypothetical protein
MGDTFYIVADETTIRGKRTFRYVQFGKQTELYINHKDLLAAFILIKDSCDSYACDIMFLNDDHFEDEIKKAFGQKWKDHVQDVSKEYEEYAVEELEPDSDWAMIRRLYEALPAEYKATQETGVSEQVMNQRRSRYQLLKFIIDGK